MAQVLELVTLAGLDEEDADARRISVSVMLEAALDDGRRVLLLEGRGWSSELRGPGAGEVDDIWVTASEREIAEQALVVVGPDEPFGGRSQDDMARDHWEALAATLRAHGVSADGELVRGLPSRVVLGEGLRARLGVS
jgi:hypothetical protein